MKKGHVADFMSGEQFETFVIKMVAAGAIADANDLADLLGVTRRTINRMREVGGDKMLALSCAALLKRLTPFDETADTATLPTLPKRVGSGRLPGSKDLAPRKKRTETEAQMRQRIEAEVRASLGLPTDNEVAA